jgi:hypothetical protein
MFHMPLHLILDLKSTDYEDPDYVFFPTYR